MITSEAFAGKSYAVYGLARSGRATVDALLASGAQVMAWDEKPEAREIGAGARIADPLVTALYGYSGIVVSPGVPINRHPIADRSRRRASIRRFRAMVKIQAATDARAGSK